MQDQQFTKLQAELQDIKDILSNIAAPNTPVPKEFLTAKEAAAFLSIKISYLYKLVHNGVLNPYKPFSKMLRFRLHELSEFIESGRIKSRAEIEQEADMYIIKSKHK